MSIGAIILYGFAFAFLPFVFSVNICGKFMTDKGTFITAGIVALVSVIGAFLVPEDLRMHAFTVLAVITAIFCVPYLFKK